MIQTEGSSTARQDFPIEKDRLALCGGTDPLALQFRPPARQGGASASCPVYPICELHAMLTVAAYSTVGQPTALALVDTPRTQLVELELLLDLPDTASPKAAVVGGRPVRHAPTHRRDRRLGERSVQHGHRSGA
eukprot:3665588-Prymnesium_polylepis.1